MTTIFPSAEWLGALQEKLNSDTRYNSVAKNWEGDIVFDIQPSGNLHEPLLLYLDLWHGACRGVEYAPPAGKYPKPKFTLRAPYDNFVAILLGKLDAMTAMMTSQLKVSGSMGYM
ncbi:MAG TPA: SCP2 sterol-binding domain-containing protein, partial [Anaerolineales bacterium]